MKERFIAAALVMVITLLRKATAINTDNLKLEQFPTKPVLHHVEGYTQVIYQVSLNESGFDPLQLEVTLGGIRIHDYKNEMHMTVIYSNCTNSNTPDWFCKKCQITLRGNIPYKKISFDLFNGPERIYHLADINIVSERPTERPTPTTPPSTIVTTNDFNSSAHNTGSIQLPISVALPVIGVLFLLILVLTIVIFCLCCQRSKNGKSKGDVEQGSAEQGSAEQSRA